MAIDSLKCIYFFHILFKINFFNGTKLKSSKSKIKINEQQKSFKYTYSFVYFRKITAGIVENWVSNRNGVLW